MPPRSADLQHWGRYQSTRVQAFMPPRSAGDMKDSAIRAAVLKSAGLEGRPNFYCKQVHGTEVVAVKDSAPFASAPEADGLVTSVPGVVLSIFVADCMPIFVWDKRGSAVGVFHAGWRGMAKGMAKRAVQVFKEEFGIPPEYLSARIGPHIGKCCFRVGADVAEQFRPGVRGERDGGIYVDLLKEATLQMIEAGFRFANELPPKSDEICTSSHPDLYFSYRRDKTDGRMMAFITLDPA